MIDPFAQVKKDIALTHRVVRESNVGGIDCLFIETRKMPPTISLIYHALGEFFHTFDWEIKEDEVVGRYLDLGGMKSSRNYPEWKRANLL